MPAKDNIRVHEPDAIYFVTNRCINEMYLLSPEKDGEVQRICLACLAWAAAKHQIEIFAYIFLSNHFHLLLRALKNNLSAFMQDFQRELASRINRYRNRRGTVFPRSFDDPTVLDDEEFLRRLEYTVNNPCHHELVDHPAEWPGVSSWKSHLSGEPQVGRFINYSKLYRLCRKEPSTPRSAAMRHDELALATPPMWCDKSTPEVSDRVITLITDAADALRRQRAERNEETLGPGAVLAQNFRERPSEPKRRPRVRCLSTDASRRAEYMERRLRTVDAYRSAMAKWRNKDENPEFPEGTCRPGLCRCETS